MKKLVFFLVVATFGLNMPLWAQNISVFSAQGQSDATFLANHLFGNNVTITNVLFNNNESINLKIYSQHRQIVIEGAEGDVVAIYDALGRRIALHRDSYGLLRFDVHSSGTYLVRIGDHPARKVVVVM